MKGPTVCNKDDACRDLIAPAAVGAPLLVSGGTIGLAGRSAWLGSAADVTRTRVTSASRHEGPAKTEGGPRVAAHAVAPISELYQVDEDICRVRLSDERKKDRRLAHPRLVVEDFFASASERCAAQRLLPQALACSRDDRRFGPEMSLFEPDVPIHTNHLDSIR